MNSIEDIITNFAGKKAVVIGDVMLDEYIEGDASRISPEAPVPVVKIQKEIYELGGAGNVASNLRSLGADVSLFSCIGNDENGKKLKELFQVKEIKTFFSECSQTIKKTRVICRGTQLLRIDKEEDSSKKFSDIIKLKLKEKCAEADIIVISDYAKGNITEEISEILKEFREKVIANPKPQNKRLYKGFLLISLNEKEAEEMSKEKNVYLAGQILKEELGSNILITRGEKGMVLFSHKMPEAFDIPTYAKEIFDVTGAGDTAVSAIALAIASGSTLNEAAIIGNHAAGIKISKRGTYSVTLEELRERISGEENKIQTLEQMKKIVEDLKRKGKKIIWTNGCFDLLHQGHVRYLKETKKLGDVLIVGLNSDSSIKRLKGPERPIQSESERAEILSSLDSVDYVVVFPEINAVNCLNELKPSIFAKAADYNISTINQDEKRVVESYNGKITFIDIVEGKSTTSIIERIKKANAI